MIVTDPSVDAVIKSYPDHVQEKLQYLRELIHETAREIPIDELTETLKWGEPSFLAKKGSTLRMDWKAKKPDQYAMYFQCSSRLVETFRLVYGDLFNYEGKRAIVFDMDDEVPVAELKKCIRTALTYHSVKSDPTLGI